MPGAGRRKLARRWRRQGEVEDTTTTSSSDVTYTVGRSVGTQ